MKEDFEKLLKLINKIQPHQGCNAGKSTNHNKQSDNKKKIDFFEEYRKSPDFWGFFLCLEILKNNISK